MKHIRYSICRDIAHQVLYKPRYILAQIHSQCAKTCTVLACTSTHMWVCTCTHIHTQTHTHIHTHMHAHTQIHTHIYTHTHMHTLVKKTHLHSGLITWIFFQLWGNIQVPQTDFTGKRSGWIPYAVGSQQIRPWIPAHGKCCGFWYLFRIALMI